MHVMTTFFQHVLDSCISMYIICNTSICKTIKHNNDAIYLSRTLLSFSLTNISYTLKVNCSEYLVIQRSCKDNILNFLL